MTDILATIAKEIADRFGRDAAKITADTHFRDDLRFDSLDGMELILAVEEAFRIRITDDEIDRVSTVGDLVAIVEEKGKS